ncbi:MAG: dUTP diphosphatase [Acidobacteriota bacterium]
MMTQLKVQRLIASAQLPTRMTAGSAGFDLYAAVATVVPASRVVAEDLVEVGRALVSTGLAFEIPQGVVGRIGARSGLSVKHNLEVGAGWIDSDYRGELMIELKNFSSRPFTIAAGDRIAQLILLTLTEAVVVEVEMLTETTRGPGGFGSTGST